ncbi:hypothetical protein V865_004406 [Kwoniella europaea PYCC6329]|uniref:RRM domain-containing protein n=1 Tax=Kwoniella europaea PYCC6329 TaxID=1423913 RepID=A0AAX4KIU2_9TREE
MTSEIYPPRARRYIDNQLVLPPRFYPDPGPEGFYPELQYPVQIRLGIRFNPLVQKQVYFQMNAVYIAGISLDMTKDRIKSHLSGITDNFIFTEFKKHPHREAMLACMEFASLKDADDVICFVRAHTRIFGGKRVTARFSDIQSNAESTRDILLVREELALWPPYSPKSIWPPSQSQYHHCNSTRYQKYRPYASLDPVKSHSRGKPPFSPTISSSSPPSKPVVCKTDTSDPSFNNEFKTPRSREAPGSLPRKPAVDGSSNKSDHNVSSDLGPSSCHDPPIPTGPKSLIERISFTPHTSSSFSLENFNSTNSVAAKTPETGVPTPEMQTDQLSKALFALTAISDKLNMNSNNLTPIAEPTRANRNHPFHSEDNHRFSVGFVHPNRQTYGRPEKGFSTSPRRRYTREDDRRISSSSSSFHQTDHSGRSSQRRSSYRTHEGHYDTHHRDRHRHRHGHHNRTRRYDHYRPESSYKAIPTTITKDEMKEFEHHFKVDEEEESTNEPKYIGISEDGRLLIFGSTRRGVELALLADYKDEDGQREQPADTAYTEETRTQQDSLDGLGSPLLSDHESVSQLRVNALDEESSEEEVEEMEDERFRIQPATGLKVDAKIKDNREHKATGLGRRAKERAVPEGETGDTESQAEEREMTLEDSKEEGEISEGLGHIDTANFHDTQSQTEVIERCQLVGNASRNFSTIDRLSRSYPKSSSPKFDFSNTLTPKLRVYRISDLSSEFLDLMGIQLRYTFKNDNLNRSDRWEDIISVESEGKGKVLRLADRDLGIRLGMSNSEFEIEGILRDGPSRSVDDESDRPCKRSRSRSGSADNEERVESVGRKGRESSFEITICGTCR